MLAHEGNAVPVCHKSPTAVVTAPPDPTDRVDISAYVRLGKDPEPGWLKENLNMSCSLWGHVMIMD